MGGSRWESGAGQNGILRASGFFSVHGGVDCWACMEIIGELEPRGRLVYRMIPLKKKKQVSLWLCR